MIVLDAYGVIALLREEPAAPLVDEILRRNESTVVTPLGIAEVVDRLVRRYGQNPDDVVSEIKLLPLDVAPLVDDVLGLRAGRLRARHYHRTERAIGLADCFVVETARALSAVVATADPHLLDTCVAEGVAVLPLPDTNGVTWQP